MDDVRVATEQARAEGYAWSRDANATSITCPTAVYLQNCGPRQASAPTKPTTQQANNALEPLTGGFPHACARTCARERTLAGGLCSVDRSHWPIRCAAASELLQLYGVMFGGVGASTIKCMHLLRLRTHGAEPLSRTRLCWTFLTSGRSQNANCSCLPVSVRGLRHGQRRWPSGCCADGGHGEFGMVHGSRVWYGPHLRAARRTPKNPHDDRSFFRLRGSDDTHAFSANRMSSTRRPRVYRAGVLV